MVRRQPMFSLKIIRIDMSEAASFRSSFVIGGAIQPYGTKEFTACNA